MVDNKMSNQEMRVKVWQDRNHYLGEGKLIGCTSMLEAYKDIYKEQDENKLMRLRVENNRSFAERTIGRKLTDEEFEQCIVGGLKQIRESSTPKIILDNGTVVYGCQIWWSEIE